MSTVRYEPFMLFYMLSARKFFHELFSNIQHFLYVNSVSSFSFLNVSRAVTIRACNFSGSSTIRALLIDP